MTKRVLALVSHPDDAEFLCAGTLALLRQKDWEVHITTMTAGDCGSKELNKQEISAVRKMEAANSAKIIGAKYECLDFEDMFITYDRASIINVLAHVRKTRPNLVITMSPACYLVDHEITSKLVRTACFVAGMVNIDTPGSPVLDYIPHLYYLDPIEGKDIYGQKIEPSTLVDIINVMDLKSDMLACHKSQRDWLREHHGMDEYLISMRRQAEETGKKSGVAYAEGFRQHLGHGFPQDNMIYRELEEFTQVVLDSGISDD